MLTKVQKQAFTGTRGSKGTNFQGDQVEKKILYIKVLGNTSRKARSPRLDIVNQIRIEKKGGGRAVQKSTGF